MSYLSMVMGHFAWTNAMGNSQKANELQDRLIEIAVRMIKVKNAMPQSAAGKHASRRLCPILNASVKTAKQTDGK